MRLDPDMELLQKIGIWDTSTDAIIRSPKFEVEQNNFLDLYPFLKHWGAGKALHELFFYQQNFIPTSPSPHPQSLKMIAENRAYFQSLEKILSMDFSKLEKITLNFGKGKNADLPQHLLSYFGGWIRKELESENPMDDTPAEKLQELKEIEKSLTSNKLKIQKAFPSVEAILKGKNPTTTFQNKQVILCTYALFYQHGYRLNFDSPDGKDPLNDHQEAFQDIAVYDNLKSHWEKNKSAI